MTVASVFTDLDTIKNSEILFANVSSYSPLQTNPAAAELSVVVEYVFFDLK